jgi:hypothetical protein
MNKESEREKGGQCVRERKREGEREGEREREREREMRAVKGMSKNFERLSM